MKTTNNLFLIGFMGAGKSSVSAALGQKLGRAVVEMDQCISENEGMTIPEIFAQKGEPYFRTCETALLQGCAQGEPRIISCGGGVVKDPANLRALHANGIVLFIDRPLEDLLVGGGRPLSTSPEALKTMEAQRRPLYLAAADAMIPNKTTPADAVTAAMEALDEIFSH